MAAKVVLTMRTVENLCISGTSLSTLEKFKCSSTPSNIKYYYAVLFLDKCIGHFKYASKYIFSLTTIVKPSKKF